MIGAPRQTGIPRLFPVALEKTILIAQPLRRFDKAKLIWTSPTFMSFTKPQSI
jgi:hypothetical protein